MAEKIRSYWRRAAVSMCSRGSPPRAAHSPADIARASSKRPAVRSPTYSVAFSAPNSSGKMPCEWSA